MTLGTGRTLIQDGDFRLIHVIDISLYERELRLIDGHIKYRVQSHNPLLPFLDHELNSVRDIIDRIKPFRKTKRSIDALGTAWKWIAGTPDRDDFRLINEKINNTMRQTENQIIINHLIEDKLNEISNRTNKILKDLHDDNDAQKMAALGLKFELEVLKEEVTKIEQALMWAKSKVINAFLFSEKEVSLLKNSVKQQRFPYSNLEQCLKFADLKIATNSSIIMYMITLPIVKLNYCQSMLIKPVKRNREIIKLDSSNVVTCQDEIYEIRSTCKSYDALSICERGNLKDISRTKCIPNLLRSKTAVCKKSNDSHIPSFEVLQPGILFFNSYIGNVVVNNNQMTINGTFIVTYHNASVFVNDTRYDFYEELGYKPLPAILASLNSTHIFEETLSLQLIKELHLDNQRYIESVKGQTRASSLLSLGTMALTLLVVMGFVLGGWVKKRQSRVITKWLDSEAQKIPNTATGDDRV